MSSSSSSQPKSRSGGGYFRWPFWSSNSSGSTLSKGVPTGPPVPCVVKEEVQDGKAEDPILAPTGQDVQDGSDSLDGPQPTPLGTAKPLVDSSDPDAKLDIVFVQDTTASQSPYIVAAKQAIETICDKIVKKTNMKKNNIRFGLIAFRDHPPQDRTYVTKEFPFTSRMRTMQDQLKGLKAQGGGDGPEAVTAALAGAMNMPWNKNAVKMIVLITDAPPHGIGEADDGFDASPDQNDPLELARQMAEEGITLFMVACEPTLSTAYKNAVDFYAALTDITGGKMLPLTMADKLGDYIAGNAVETIETERLIKQYKDKIVDNVYGQGKPLEEVVEEMQKDLERNNVHINTYEAPAAYVPSTTGAENQAKWKSAKLIAEARKRVVTTQGIRYTASPRVESDEDEPFPSEASGARGKRCSNPVSNRPRPSDGSSPSPTRARGTTSAAQPSLFSKKIDLSQTKRVVMQSMARVSKVTENGMTRKTEDSSPPVVVPAPGEK